jgi:cholest-4-en-3-one 26-monooxygenase
MNSHRDDHLLTDPSFFAAGDPHAIWTRLRKEDPVHSTLSALGREFWSLTRHAEVQSVLKNAELFSSQQSGVSLPTNLELIDPKKSEHARLSQAGAMLPTLDPPRHTKARAAFSPRFTPSVVNVLENRVRQVTGRILDDVAGRSECDFVLDIAARLPISTIFSIMNIPESDWAMLFNYANMHTAPDDPEFSIGSPLETRQRGALGLIGYCREIALKRRTAPADDLLSLIATVAIDDQQLSEDELGFLGHMFVIAGQETTRNSLSAGILQLIGKPDQAEQLRSNPALLRTMPDEFIRWASPVAHLMRTATADTELGGKTIREGDWVVAWLASANRDEGAFKDPFRFDVGRSPNPHVSFGFGPHFCLGAFLGRLQIRVMVVELLNRFRSIELAGDPQYVASIQFCGLKRMPVKLTPRAG